MSLDHWMLSQAQVRAGQVNSGLANAGWNLLEMPAGLNRWLGFAPNWGGTDALLARLARWGIRAGVPASAGAAGYAGHTVAKKAREAQCICQ